MSYKFEFITNISTVPYVSKVISYDLSGSEGCIHFNGYYYVNDSHGNDTYHVSLPQTLYIVTSRALSDPIYTDLSGGVQRVHYEGYEQHFYSIEIYDRIEVDDTSSYDEQDGMRVCYFPTMEQKLYFHVLKELHDTEEMANTVKHLI